VSVIVARPPNFELILRAFPKADQPGVIFAFGDDVYNPSGVNIPAPLIAHEGVHQSAQRKITPERWWERYVAEPDFRYDEELRAHVAEFKAQDYRGLDRNLRAKLLQHTAQRLVAPLYNYPPTKTLTQAIRDLRWELDKK
jgi:hypothetical protein